MDQCNIRLLFICLLLVFSSVVVAQTSFSFEDSFTEEMTDQDKFSIYLDSANKYLYRDIFVTEFALSECQKIIERDIPLHDTLLFEYVIEKIYYAHSMEGPLEAYQFILNHSDFLESEEVTYKQKASFNYLTAYTYMANEDTEAAQEAYYKNLELAQAKKDTAQIISTYYSLGQLLNDADVLEDAIQFLEKALDLCEIIKIRPSTFALVYKELGESYSNVSLDSIPKAIEALNKGYKISKENGLGVLASDILLMKGKLFLKQENMDSAIYVLEEVENFNRGSKDQQIDWNIQDFLALFYSAKGMYSKALDIYKEEITKTDSTNKDKLIYTYGKAYELSDKMDDPLAAYDFLKKYRAVKEEKDEDEKRQKVAYLKIKFDTEKEKKENAILSAEIIQNKAERKQLYFLLILSGLVLLILFGAFYQKQRYSKRLETEVSKRTDSLRETNHLLNQRNAELDEFNRILSHDLKEPLRGIVSFSQLAKQKIVGQPPKVREYLDFVTQGGKQLEQLIAGVNLYRKVSSAKPEESQSIDLNELINETVSETQSYYLEKQIKVVCESKEDVISSKQTLHSIFKILVDNATKYNDQKSVEISIDHDVENGMHHFKITDNGIGIDQRYHDQIFEMFKRLNDRKRYPGSGLGLSIAQRLLESIDGSISVLQSKENEGSTFLVKIPTQRLD